MVAGMGVSDTATLSKMWKGFNDHIAQPLRKKQIPFAFTIGNHDGLRSYPTERNALTKHWSQPDHQTGLHFIDKVNFPHYYSFQAGETFIISWDASSSEITPENLRWVEQQLQSEASKRSKARIVVGHLPIYSVAQERDSKGNVLENGDELRKLLEKFQVKVYVSGHQHAYYPGKRGKLELLNAGAAGSGPRRWLTMDKAPVNTITIMDVFYDKDTIAYTTYDIKHRSAQSMSVFDYQELPSSITGVNGFLIRKDMPDVTELIGTFYSVNPAFNNIRAYGRLNAYVTRNKITINGNFNLKSKPSKKTYAVKFYEGDFNEVGKPLFEIQVRQQSQSAKFQATFDITESMIEKLAVGKYFVEVSAGEERLRGQLYPLGNTPPSASRITSHVNGNIYGIRNTKGLYNINWTPSHDHNGDKLFYIYQLASDSLFENPAISVNTNQRTSFKLRESDLYVLLKSNKKKTPTFYHRVIVTDGLHVTHEKHSAVRFTMSDELPTDFIELEAEQYIFDGKIDNATGQGSGALWDKNGKLWLADYGGSLFVNLPDGKPASFSPLQSVTINDKSYSLKPINGISLDLDGNILIGSNRLLIKVDAQTGKGIAVWEAPEGKRSITTPRANNKGEIYVMSLFAEDPNYVLKQSATTGTFDLVRTINLPQRILSRTFDMKDDGLTLFFPDPGSPFIQIYKSNDGINYKRIEDITSVEAGCNAIRYSNNTLFAAVRSSGISASTLHVRDEKQKVMWTLPLAELNGAEARGIAVSPDQKTIIICSWDNGGGFYRYRIRDAGY
jgi:Icc-related predicted phosphoesterase